MKLRRNFLTKPILFETATIMRPRFAPLVHPIAYPDDNRAGKFLQGAESIPAVVFVLLTGRKRSGHLRRGGERNCMGICYGKPASPETHDPSLSPTPKTKEEESAKKEGEAEPGVTVAEERTSKPWTSPFFPFYSPSPAHSLFKKSPSVASEGGGSATATPRRIFKRPFPPPSPAKHIRALLARRHGSVKPNEAAIPEDEGEEGRAVAGLDKSFGFSKGFTSKYEIGEEVGRGHFGYTCTAKLKKGENNGQQVAVKVIPKAKVTSTRIARYLAVPPKSTIGGRLREKLIVGGQLREKKGRRGKEERRRRGEEERSTNFPHTALARASSPPSLASDFFSRARRKIGA
ncbi:hypothetical protein BHE74_00013568, partial [Ensete ventricosum]